MRFRLSIMLASSFHSLLADMVTEQRNYGVPKFTLSREMLSIPSISAKFPET